jgi:hypothetical protein
MTLLIDMYTDSKNICYPWRIDEYKSKSVSTVHNSISITIHGACAHIHNGGLYPWENMCLTDAWVQILMSMSMDTEISIHRLSMHFPKVRTSNPKIISELCIKAMSNINPKDQIWAIHQGSNLSRANNRNKSHRECHWNPRKRTSQSNATKYSHRAEKSTRVAENHVIEHNLLALLPLYHLTLHQTQVGWNAWWWWPTRWWWGSEELQFYLIGDICWTCRSQLPQKTTPNILEHTPHSPGL